MSTSKSTYLENKFLDTFTQNTSVTGPVTLFFALSTASITAPSGTGFTEVTGGSYARASLAATAGNWPNASNGSKSNNATIAFVTASANWGTIVAVAMFDAASSGNMLWFGDLQTSKAVNNGDTAQFAVGALTIQEV